MATGKKPKEITISHSPGIVGVHMSYEDAPTENTFLKIDVAKKLRDKIDEAIALASQPRHPGSDVGISEHIGMKILNPQEH